MLPGLIAKKLDMTQYFTDDGQHVAVTALEVGPCTVVCKRSPEKEGYAALQIGFGEESKSRRKTKPLAGQFKKAGITPKRLLTEIRIDKGALGAFEPGQVIGLDGIRGTESGLAQGDAPKGGDLMFKPGDKVKITGTSKGKGFQGVIRRWKSNRGPMSHGSRFHRFPGAIGCRTDPGKVNKGHHMPGHMGARQVTIRNLEVMRVDAANNLLLVKGAVPGPKNGIVQIAKDTPFIR